MTASVRRPFLRPAARRRSVTLASGAALAALLVLAGCSAGASSDASGDADPSATAGATTSSAPELPGTITVLAAASLTETFDALATQFEQLHPGVDVVLSYGGSSALAEQIVAGAPADVFAAASDATMTTVTDASLTATDPQLFATNVLEIAVPAGNPAGVTGIDDLTDGDLTLALCAVEVPCGAAAQKVFDTLGVEVTADTYEEDVKGVLTKVELGEVDAGLVYATDVLAAGDQVEGIEFPEAQDAVNDYPIALLSDSANADAAQAWIDFVLGETGQSALAAAGFGAAQ